jgi:hypothetical protein
VIIIQPIASDNRPRTRQGANQPNP